MKMPLRLAIAIGKTLRLGVYDKEFDTITKLVDHAEATRWRKLREEKPEKEGEYLVAVPCILGNGYFIDKATWMLHGFNDEPSFGMYAVSHWAEINEPEEES